MELPYNSYSESLVRRYGYRIYRVGIDAGFTCPNRCKNPDGSGCVYCDSQGAKAVYHRRSESSFRHDSDFVSDIDSMSSESNDNTKELLSINKEDIKNQVTRGIAFLSSRYKAQHFAAYLQSFSNTFAPLEKLRELYDYIASLHSWEGFIVSTRPDCIDKAKVELLKSYEGSCKAVCVELGLQSGSDRILDMMGRGHDVACLERAANMVKDAGLELCLHVLTGFPSEGKAELDKTIDVICNVHPHAVKIHNLNIVAGTRLYDSYLYGEVTAPSMTRHIESTIYLLRRIPSDIVIERLMCETPNHRLASPRAFADKNRFLRTLESCMEKRGAFQGELCQRR